MGLMSWVNNDPAETQEEKEFLERFVTWGLWILAAIVVAATITGQTESFHGLYNWFATHGFQGFWAYVAPLMVDSFTVIGELAIFAGIARHWEAKARILPWFSVILGIAASVAGNVGDVSNHSWTWMATAAIPPLAGAFGIVIGLGVLKRVARDVAEKRRAKADKIETPKWTAEEYNEGAKKTLEILDFDTPEIEAVPEPETKNDDKLKGLDVLIPPKKPRSELGSLVQPPLPFDFNDTPHTTATVVEKGRPLITTTGSFPAV